jgi:hypothetical protein
VVNATAWDPPPLVVGFSAEDRVALTFSSPTDAPPLTAVTVLFSPPIGATSWAWSADNTTLVFTVEDAAGVDAVGVDVATGRLSVTVGGLRSAGGRSSPSPPVVVTVGACLLCERASTPVAVVGVCRCEGRGAVGPVWDRVGT